MSNKFSLTYGPFKYVQLVYTDLTVSPDGDVVAFFKNGIWRFVDDDQTRELLGEGVDCFNSDKPGTLDDTYTDVVIYSTIPKDEKDEPTC